jgi:signal transduction histidine kinase
VDVGTVPVRTLLSEVQALIEPLAIAKKLDFTCDTPRTEIVLHSDMRKMRQILVNLLGNAVKFTDRGGVSLSVRDDVDRVHFDVLDTGIGIAPRHLEDIFEPFWQVESGIGRSKEGTGPGLSVTRRLIDLLGGQVTVDSTPGKGSHFIVTIPKTPRQAVPAE